MQCSGDHRLPVPGTFRSADFRRYCPAAIVIPNPISCCASESRLLNLSLSDVSDAVLALPLLRLPAVAAASPLLWNSLRHSPAADSAASGDNSPSLIGDNGPCPIPRPLSVSSSCPRRAPSNILVSRSTTESSSTARKTALSSYPSPATGHSI